MISLIGGSILAIVVTVIVIAIAKENIPIALGVITGWITITAVWLRDVIVETSKKSEK